MNYLKKMIEIVGALLMAAGFFVLVGTAGASDYADEIGEVFSYTEHIPHIISGFVMLFVGGAMVKYLEGEGWYEKGGED